MSYRIAYDGKKVRMSSKYRSIDEYIEQQSKTHAEKLKELRNLNIEAVPKAEETLNYGVHAFTLLKGR